ncbi:MAG: hypothetical protein A2046_11035 [Bacteroidetes bacterium GWA2_30_7]|nr:MAG: hypothetical protein A2046_11035 [Bacteroidetes bacterium GWA2_30_7]
MIKFAHPQILYSLVLIPLFYLLFWLYNRMKKKSLKKFGDLNLLKSLMPDISYRRPFFKFLLLSASLLFLIIGIADPQIGSKLEEVKRKGIELVIALDVSNSMMAEDIQPNRLERAKQAIAKLVDNLHNDKIGLIVFAGDAYVQLPITTDYASAKMFLNAINTQIVPIQGTAIGKAIELASKSFTPEAEKNKAIIIITDGENHEDDAVGLASDVVAKGITVHTIGMGLPQGAPIPIIGKYGQRDFKTDKSGQVVVSKLDETMLQQIAAAGNGIYIRANNTSVGLSTLFDELNKMEKKEFETDIYSDYEDRFQYFIGLSLFFLLLEFILLERKNKFFKNVNIFKINN